MRDIKFRGKRLDNGEWAIGSYIEAEMQNGIAHEIVPYKHGEPVVEVDPKTVGQYTDFNDKNGKEIFEGDILLIYGVKHIVRYKFAAFFACPINNQRTNESLLYSVVSAFDSCEIIGNIHDNPKLLKGGQR